MKFLIEKENKLAAFIKDIYEAKPLIPPEGFMLVPWPAFYGAVMRVLLCPIGKFDIDKSISIYLDIDKSLSLNPRPHYEIYPGSDGLPEQFDARDPKSVINAACEAYHKFFSTLSGEAEKNER